MQYRGIHRVRRLEVSPERTAVAICRCMLANEAPRYVGPSQQASAGAGRVCQMLEEHSLMLTTMDGYLLYGGMMLQISTDQGQLVSFHFNN